MVGQSVSKSVSLGVEPHLGLMTRDLLLFDSHSLVLRGARSDERTGLSFVRVTVCSNKSFVIMQKIFTILHVIHGNNVYTICTGPLSVQAQYSRLCPISSSFRCNSNQSLERSYAWPPPSLSLFFEWEWVTLRLAAYRQSIRLDARPLQTHDQKLFFQLNSCGIVLM
jgi:hypothetical protein